MSTAIAEPAGLGLLDLSPEDVVSVLLERAVQLPASDLFLETHAGHIAVLVRHLGLIRPFARLPLDLGQRCISHIKAVSQMDVTDHRRPQEGRWCHELQDRPLNLHVNSMPTLYGEDCCLRLLGTDQQGLSLEHLGLIPQDLNDLRTMLDSPSGLILVTGPSGAGKTSTVYACLRYLNNGERRINTIEDPIEYGIDGVRQSQVNPRIGLDFADLLRSVIQQAPDVIMIGEIRDAVTAATAVHAASSGHLVLATVHAPVAAQALESMRAWGVPSYFLASSLLGVLAQRLVRALCPKCRKPYPLNLAPNVFDDVLRWLKPGEGLVLYSAGGCAACQGSGYAARTGVFEVLRVDHSLRALIAEGKSLEAVRKHAIAHGMIQLRQAALLKVAQGQTTAEEVVRLIPAEDLGLDS